MFDGSLGGEKRSQDVGVENPMEMFFGDRFDRHEFVNSGVVNQNIEAAVVFCSCVDNGLSVGGLGYVALYRDSGTAGFLNGGYDVISPGPAGSIGDHDRGGLWRPG